MEQPETTVPATAEDRFGHWLDVVLGGVSALVLFLLMLLTLVDVVGRYLFNAPVPGGYELTQLLMAVLIFCALPVISWRETHITIDLLDFMVSGRTADFRQVLVNAVSAAGMGLIGWRCWIYAGELAGYGDVTEYLHISQAPIVYFIAIFSIATALLLVANMLRYATGHAGSRSKPGKAVPGPDAR
jgi:TRAP-type C4-dicarboxylate transport system permease small subunit